MPLHFISVEHERLEKRFGEHRGRRVGSILGIISGWGYFIFLFGLWLSPQPRLFLPMEEIVRFSIPIVAIEISLVNIVLGFFFLIPGAWLGLRGVLDLGLHASETHRPERLVKAGLYRKIRHPQYLGAILSHLGISIMLSSLYSFLVTPILMIRDFVICKKEDRELAQEFGKEYEDYQDNVPMFLPEKSSQ